MKRIASAALVVFVVESLCSLGRPEKIAVTIRMTPRAPMALMPRIGRLKVGMYASAIRNAPTMHTRIAQVKAPTRTPLLGASGRSRMLAGQAGALHV